MFFISLHISACKGTKIFRHKQKIDEKFNINFIFVTKSATFLPFTRQKIRWLSYLREKYAVLIVPLRLRKKVFFCGAFSFKAKGNGGSCHSGESMPKIRWKTCLRTILGMPLR